MVRDFVLASAIAYLLGSIPFGLVLVRIFRGIDVRQTGSGNIGTANVARIAPGLGLWTLVLDSAKGLVAVLVARAVAVSSSEGLKSVTNRVECALRCTRAYVLSS